MQPKLMPSFWTLSRETKQHKEGDLRLSRQVLMGQNIILSGLEGEARRFERRPWIRCITCQSVFFLVRVMKYLRCLVGITPT